MRRAAALLTFLGAAASAAGRELPPAPPGAISYTADAFDYDDSSAVIHLKGNVVLKESTWTVRSQEIWVDTVKRQARTEGYVLLDDGVAAVKGARGEFDLAEQVGWLEEAVTAYGDWRVRAEGLKVGPGRRAEYHGAVFSGCAEEPMHYHLSSGLLKVVPNSHLLAYNTVFKIGPIPVFYLPIFYTPLRDIRVWDSRLQAGYDRRNGVFLKTSFLRRHTDHLYSKFFIDGYTGQGLGYGWETHGRKSNDARLGLFGYHIYERKSREHRWAVLGDQFQVLTSSLSFQGRVQIQSDAEFNNHYARSKEFRITPELINSGALVYTLPSATARLSFSRTDVDEVVATPGLGSRGRGYVKQTESLPRLDVQTAPLRLWKLPWLNNFAGFADNNADRNRGFQQQTFGASWEATRSFRVARGVSLTPKASLRETFISREEALTSFASTETRRNVIVGRPGAGANLRFDSPVGDWDLGYAYELRLKPGTFMQEAGALDRGVESSLATLQDTFRPARRVMVRVASGYDFRTFRDYVVGFRRRVQPIVAEVGYAATSRLDFSVRNDYQLEDGNRSFLMNVFYGEFERSFGSLGFGHNLALPQKTLVNLEFGLDMEPRKAAGRPSAWKLGGALRGEAVSTGGVGRVRAFRLYEKEITIDRKLHDFHLRALTRFRPGGVREFAFRLEMRFPGTKRAEIARREWEEEFFPERRRKAEDRP